MSKLKEFFEETFNGFEKRIRGEMYTKLDQIERNLSREISHLSKEISNNEHEIVILRDQVEALKTIQSANITSSRDSSGRLVRGPLNTHVREDRTLDRYEYPYRR